MSLIDAECIVIVSRIGADGKNSLTCVPGETLKKIIVMG